MKVFAAVMMFTAAAGADALAGEWTRVERGSFTCVAVAQAGGTVFAGTAAGDIAVSNDGGRSWEHNRCTGGYAARVRAICQDENSRITFAAADSGIFRSDDGGRKWERVFKAGTGRECLDIAATPEGIYAATNAGIMLSRDGRSWKRDPAIPKAESVEYSRAGSRIFSVVQGVVYGKQLPSGAWEKVHGSGGHADDLEENAAPEVDEPGRTLQGRLAADKAGSIAVALGNRVLRSGDYGRMWEDISPGAAAGGVTALLSLPQGVLAGSPGGLYLFRGGSWEDFSDGISGSRVNGLSRGSTGIFAAADDGIYMAPVQSVCSAARASFPLERYLAGDPAVGDVQRAAVEYADAGPGKITRWRRLAQKRAWLPRLSVGLERETNDLWHWESGSTARTEDDSLRKGKDTLGWDVSLSWELGDLVWNGDQTDIDARSRLNSELRAEVIAEITRLYYERVRLKMEIDRLALEDRKKRAEKQVKLEETTALLDALTGGEFGAFGRFSEAKKTCKR